MSPRKRLYLNVGSLSRFNLSNDMDLAVDNEILKFADDTELYGIVTNRDEALSL